MKKHTILMLLGLMLAGIIGGSAARAADTAALPYHAWAKTPPMGWNSWDCFGAAVTEAQTKANTDYMAEKLKPYGWQYIIVDIQWYESTSRGSTYASNPQVTLDANGRLWPSVKKFPSAAAGKGFKPLADYVHGKGLKFGVHLMRGIPKAAVTSNTAIMGTNYHAADIADKRNVCAWNPDMYGVDMSKPGAQEYYNSVFKLLASWDIDYVKVDDLSAPRYHEAEVTAIRKAIDATGRPMVLSTSPGETPLSAGPHVAEHANMWRVSNDFWDNWQALYEQFKRLDNWTPFRGEGHWPDADMLPLGALEQWRPRKTRFTPDEQLTMMTLWSIARSPLMIGADMPQNDTFTESLLTNAEVLAVNQASANNRQLFRHDPAVAWVADAPGGKAKYLAVFNATAPEPRPFRRRGGFRRGAPGQPTPTPRPTPTPAPAPQKINVAVKLADLGFSGKCKVRDLWQKKDLGTFSGEFAPAVVPHGAGLYRVEQD